MDWISTRDRLPNTSRTVIVTWSMKGSDEWYKGSSNRFIGIANYVDGEWYWLDPMRFPEDHPKVEDSVIVAWQDFPDPYKE